MNRFVCIHGHFYQPPRENPWLEEVELQDSAHPFHDWNERITAECYGPNAHARILDSQGMIVDMVSNYSRMSFNFGPTLLRWLERREPEIHEAIVAADRESRTRFSGHGSAMAQCYGHAIMPLAVTRDKLTQISWGIRDFEYRFGRQPEGMWLPETAVDAETLDIMADHGIAFTVLAPRQAAGVWSAQGGERRDVSGARIDPRHPYRVALPSGREIAVFFYDGQIAHEIAFGGILHNGERLAQRLLEAFDAEGSNQLVHVATDGESYGHHHRGGEMALAYCMRHLESCGEARLTNYAEYLALNPPQETVELFERSSWSCVHGVERWQADCGCNSGAPGLHQKWRAPLRGAMDWLRDTLSRVYEDGMALYTDDPWAARNRYIEVVLQRGRGKADLEAVTGSVVEESAARRRLLELLEMQRNALLMFTSCGWFFDDVSGLEATQVIAYAARAIQLGENAARASVETTFVKLLERAPGNDSDCATAAEVYRMRVKPSVVDVVKVGAHLALSSVFDDSTEKASVYCYDVGFGSLTQEEAGRHRLASGEVGIASQVTEEMRLLAFTAVYLGEYNVTAGVKEIARSGEAAAAQSEIAAAFRRSDPGTAMRLVSEYFAGGTYTLWDLFRDEQRHVLTNLLRVTLDDIEISLRQIKEHYYPLINVVRQRGVPLPKMFTRILESICEADLLRAMAEGRTGLIRMKEAVGERRQWSLALDRTRIAFAAGGAVNSLMQGLRDNPDDRGALITVREILAVLAPLELRLNIWKAQNNCFVLTKGVRPGKVEGAAGGDEGAAHWTAQFDRLAAELGVKVP